MPTGGYHPVYCQCIAAAGARREHLAGKRLRDYGETPHEGYFSRIGWCDVVWRYSVLD